MKELLDTNLWDLWERDFIACITTNGDVNHASKAVMGRGVAKEAATRFRELPLLLGERLRRLGNHVFFFPRIRVISFPVKHHWQEDADMKLITRSLRELLALANALDLENIALVRPGCGSGRLSWRDVRPYVEAVLDERFVIAHKEIA